MTIENFNRVLDDIRKAVTPLDGPYEPIVPIELPPPGALPPRERDAQKTKLIRALDQYDSQLADLSKTLLHVSQAFKRAKTEVDRRRGRVREVAAPVSMLSPEILGYIFLIGRDSTGLRDEVSFLKCISQVSRRWRMVAIGYPQLWCHIEFSHQSTKSLSFKLDRAGTGPLHLTANNYRDRESLVTLMKGHATRWTHVTLTGPHIPGRRSDVNLFLDLIPTSQFPALRSLELISNNYGDRDLIAMLKIPLVPLDRLENLRLSGFRIMSSAHLPPRIRTMTLVHCVTDIPWWEMVSQCCPALHALEDDCGYLMSTANGQTPAIAFESLRHLVLRRSSCVERDLTWLRFLATKVHSPALQSLQIFTKKDEGGIIRPFGTLLETIIANHPLITCLAFAAELIVVGDLLRAIFPEAGNPSGLVPNSITPNLRDLTVYCNDLSPSAYLPNLPNFGHLLDLLADSFQVLPLTRLRVNWGGMPGAKVVIARVPRLELTYCTEGADTHSVRGF